MARFASAPTSTPSATWPTSWTGLYLSVKY